jgi:hypothetical protein
MPQPFNGGRDNNPPSSSTSREKTGTTSSIKQPSLGANKGLCKLVNTIKGGRKDQHI